MPAIKYDEIYLDLKKKILNGTYAYESLLPSEHRCEKIYGVSRNTVRRAIKKLEAEGYVLSRHGLGVKVIFQMFASSLYVYDPVESFDAFGYRYHLNATTKLLMMTTITADENIVLQSGFKLGEEILLLMRLRLIDDQPVILEINMLKKDVYHRLDQRQAQESLTRYLEDHGHRLKACSYDVSSETASDLDRQYVNAQASIMQIVRKHLYDQESVLIDYTEVRALPNLFRFHHNIIVWKKDPRGSFYLAS